MRKKFRNPVAKNDKVIDERGGKYKKIGSLLKIEQLGERENSLLMKKKKKTKNIKIKTTWRRKKKNVMKIDRLLKIK